jgi:hypothetical protein
MMAKKTAKKAKYADEAYELNRLILASRLSPREIAYKFGRPEEKIREMMEGNIKPDGVIMYQLRGGA